MAVDSVGHGFLVGGTISISVVVVSLDLGGTKALVKMPDGKVRALNQQKSSPYGVGSNASISGTVVGFIDGGATAVIQESDKNIVAIPCSGCTAS